MLSPGCGIRQAPSDLRMIGGSESSPHIFMPLHPWLQRQCPMRLSVGSRARPRGSRRRRVRTPDRGETWPRPRHLGLGGATSLRLGCARVLARRGKARRPAASISYIGLAATREASGPPGETAATNDGRPTLSPSKKSTTGGLSVDSSGALAGGREVCRAARTPQVGFIGGEQRSASPFEWTSSACACSLRRSKRGSRSFFALATASSLCRPIEGRLGQVS